MSKAQHLKNWNKRTKTKFHLCVQYSVRLHVARSPKGVCRSHFALKKLTVSSHHSFPWPRLVRSRLSPLAHTFSSPAAAGTNPLFVFFKSSLSFRDSSTKDGRARSDTSRRGPAILRGRREAARGLVHPQRRQGGYLRPAQNSQVSRANPRTQSPAPTTGLHGRARRLPIFSRADFRPPPGSVAPTGLAPTADIGPLSRGAEVTLVSAKVEFAPPRVHRRMPANRIQDETRDRNRFWQFGTFTAAVIGDLELISAPSGHWPRPCLTGQPPAKGVEVVTRCSPSMAMQIRCCWIR